MISHKYKCIFVEVPKTGTTSIRSIIGQPPKPHQNICQIKFEMENYWTRYGGNLNKVIASLYLLLPRKTRERNGRKLFNTYFKFGFVRNPWDRVVSLYLRKEGLQLSQKMSFPEFVRWIKYSSSTCNHSVPHVNQLDWFVDPHGEILVDFIGKFENLQKDWHTVSKKIGAQDQLPHKKKNDRKVKHYTEYYSAESKRIIENKFGLDIEYFGYEFGE